MVLIGRFMFVSAQKLSPSNNEAPKPNTIGAGMAGVAQ